MKKTISFLLIIAVLLSFCFSLSACSSKGTKLTLENYSDYLSVGASVENSGRVDIKGAIWLGKYSGGYKSVHSYFSPDLIGYIYTSNLAPNFNYMDVEITVKFTGEVVVLSRNCDTENPDLSKKPFEFEGKFGLTVGGKSKGDEARYPLPSNLMTIDDMFHDYSEYELKYQYEVVNISGTVVPA